MTLGTMRVNIMQPIEHFLLSLIAGIGVGLHLDNIKKKYLIIFILACIATAIDLDHLLPMYTQGGIKAFHNIFLLIFFPVVLFIGASVYESRKGGSIYQRNMLILAVLFVGHMLQDSMTGNIPLFYPISKGQYTVISLGFTVDSVLFSLTTQQSLLLIWGGIIAFANLVETVIYRCEEGKEERIKSSKPEQMIDIGKPTRTSSPKTMLYTISRNPICAQHALTCEAEKPPIEICPIDTIIECEPDEIIDEYIFSFIDNL
jgi:membrane-bound metal-dependent hydrolase YbcI (DUF457 family)